jgi:hypothetical protein
MSTAALLMMNASFRNGYQRNYYPKGPMGTGGRIFIGFWLILAIVMMIATIAMIPIVIYHDHQRGNAQIASWQAFELANGGQAKVVGVASQTGGTKSKHTEIVVEFRGMRDQKEMVVRERADMVQFDHVPVIGQKWGFHVKDRYLYVNRLE